VVGRRTTIHDLARIAGVSAGTVSRALNGQNGVGQGTRQRISALAEEHGFIANATARRLSTGRSWSVGVVIPFHTSELMTSYPVHVGLLGGLGDAAEAAGYDLVLLNVASVKAIDRLLDAVQRRKVDGVVLPAAAPNDRPLRTLAAIGFPTVVIGHRTRRQGVPWVDSSHDVACYQLTRVMIESGRRRVAFVTDAPSRVSALRLRLNGFRAAVAAMHDRVEAASEQVVGTGWQEVREQVRALLSGRCCDAPDAIVASRDRLAYVCLEVARELRIPVPERLAVCGFDDLHLSQLTTPPLTTVRMPVHQLALRAGEMLFSLIEGREPAPMRLVLPTELVLRQSTPAESNALVPCPVMGLSLHGWRARPASAC
jgi:LacI family transcriptional regulator